VPKEGWNRGGASAVEGLLEASGIQLGAVVSDPFGVSGWAMLQRLADGETNIEAMLEETRGVLRKKKSGLREAWAGKSSTVSRLLLKQVTLLRQQIAEIHEAWWVAMKAYASTLHRLCRMPGVDLTAAQEILAEIGPRGGAFPVCGGVCFLGGSHSRNADHGGGQLPFPITHGEIGPPAAGPDCLGGRTHQGHLLRQPIRRS
jgi:hypothetical protein